MNGTSPHFSDVDRKLNKPYYQRSMGVINDVQILLGKETPKKTVKKAPPRKLLIVEDEPILREMYREKFTLAGFNVITAENGQIGLAKVIEQKPNILLLDLMMPVMDGRTMLRKVRAIPEFKTMPVVVLTNAGEVENIRHTQVYDNAIEFMIKSNISLEEIVTKVKRLL